MIRLLLIALALPYTATAAEIVVAPYTDRPLDFRLHFTQASLDLDYGGARIDTTVERIGVAWRERYGRNLQLGLFGGYAYLTQGNNAATAGRELDGYHAGFSLDLELFTIERATLFLAAAWLYQKVDDDDGAQRVVISWNEPSARIGVSGLLGGAVRAYGGARYGSIDGQQRLRGTINETRAIGQTDRSGGFVGLELNLEREGYVGVVAESGPDRHTSVYFGRRF